MSEFLLENTCPCCGHRLSSDLTRSTPLYIFARPPKPEPVKITAKRWSDDTREELEAFWTYVPANQGHQGVSPQNVSYVYDEISLKIIGLGSECPS